jgi:hypothetical protein
MKGKKICKRCGKKIIEDEKAVMLMTFIGNKNLEKVYWHWQCYLDWRNESLENRAKELYYNSMQGALKQLPGFLNKIGLNNGQEENKYKVCEVGIS